MGTSNLNVRVAARTFEVDSQLVDDDLFILGGKMAGVCYMPEDYFDGKIQNEEKAENRANNTCASGHHSVFDHCSITFQISGIPKIMAMLLNSTEQYTTSEKSARYTVMKPETELENELYESWISKFDTRIKEVYPDIDDKTRHKLALENARYLISVFTPTHMMWTTTYRQAAYIIGWLGILEEQTKNLNGDFNKKLSYWCKTLREALENVTKSNTHIRDNKNRTFEFPIIQSKGLHIDNKEIIGDVYQITYLASFAQLAQLHRHRTIHYEMDFSGETATEYGVYIPPIIRGTELEEEWVRDFNRLAYCYPQGTLVKVLEQGRAIKFFEKCKERLCGRAQLEVMQNSALQMQKFIDNRDNLSSETLKALKEVTDNFSVTTKCHMDGIKCTEVCRWAGTKALDRLI